MEALGICYLNTEEKTLSYHKVVEEDIKEERDLNLSLQFK